MTTHLYDVAIVGYGPAGATLANLLGQAGLSVCVLEKEAGIYPLPRAIHFDGEVMRIFQSIGLRSEIEAISRPGLQGMHFVNAQGDTLLIRGGTSALGPHGCASNYYFNQPDLESVLRKGAQRFTAVHVYPRHGVTAISETADHATLTISDLRADIASEVRARYVVGCDGARSLVRTLLGSSMKDLGLAQQWLVFDVFLKPGAPAMPDHTVQYCDPSRPMTYCNVTGNRRRWEVMLLPGDDPASLVKPETLWTMVKRWITPEHADIERAVIYTFNSLIAIGWRKQRMMLAGDAAHQMPPFLGQGMCAAIRDASNIAWKLIAVLREGASDALLDTYESERSPHVRAFIELAVRLGGIIQTTDPQQARERDERFKAGQPEIFEFPAPRLGAGVLFGDATPVGLPFPQPQLDDGQWLDARIGNRFAIIARPSVLDGVTLATRATWQGANVAILPTSDSALIAWLDSHRVDAVVLRPDRYIMGTATSSAALDELTAMLPVCDAAFQIAAASAC